MITAVDRLLDLRVASTNMVMLYLLGIVFVSLRWGFGPALAPSLISTFTFDFIFIPPYLSFAEAAGVRVIQVEEPALLEGLPLRQSERAAYLGWAVDAFRVATGGIRDETQIHTHMFYVEFGEILDSIVRMDADVISMEATGSRMELLDAFAGREHLNNIGPSVYDIHSPRVPSAGEMEALIRKALTVFRPEQLCVNPDSGLKTRRCREVRLARQNMVTAARRVRGSLALQTRHRRQSEETGA